MERETVEGVSHTFEEYDSRRAYEGALRQSLHILSGWTASFRNPQQPSEWPRSASSAGARHNKKDCGHWKHPLDGLLIWWQASHGRDYVTVLDAFTKRSKRWVKKFLLREFPPLAPPRTASRDVVRRLLALRRYTFHNQRQGRPPPHYPVHYLRKEGARVLKRHRPRSRHNPKPIDHPARVRISTDLKVEALADLQRAKELLGRQRLRRSDWQGS